MRREDGLKLLTPDSTDAEKSESANTGWIVALVAGTFVALILFGLVNFIIRHNEAVRIESTYGVTISHGIRDDGVKDGKFKVVGWGDTKECMVPRTEAEWSKPLNCIVTTTSTHEAEIAPVQEKR